VDKCPYCLHPDMEWYASGQRPLSEWKCRNCGSRFGIVVLEIREDNVKRVLNG
jgi:transposase-like protein